MEVVVTSPQLDFDEYPNAEISQEQVVHIMIGDLQRIMLLGPEKGAVAGQRLDDVNLIGLIRCSGGKRSEQ